MDEMTFETIKMTLTWLPVPFLFFVYYVMQLFTKHKWKAIHLAVDISAILFILTSAILMKELFNIRIIGYLIVILIVLLAVLLIIQWKKETDVLLLKAVRQLMRLLFLPFFFFYIGLIICKLIMFFI